MDSIKCGSCGTFIELVTDDQLIECPKCKSINMIVDDTKLLIPPEGCHDYGDLALRIYNLQVESENMQLSVLINDLVSYQLTAKEYKFKDIDKIIEDYYLLGEINNVGYRRLIGSYILLYLGNEDGLNYLNTAS